jgi:xylose isomerase
MNARIMADAVVFDTYAERYVPRGYHGEMGLEERFKIMAGIDGLHGQGITWPADPLPDDPGKLRKLFESYGLSPGDLSVINYDDRKWKHGALCTNEDEIRKENIALCKEAADFAAEIPGTKVMIWPAHDGFDYPFQTDYSDGWKHMVESLQEICEYNRDVTVCIEYKQKDPRQRFYISNVGKLMALFNDVGADNLKGVIDTGHALQAQESLAEDLVFLLDHDKLGIIHVNDNYRDADPDLIFGTVAFWDNLEFFYYLNRSGYGGTIEIDYQNPRDDRIKSLRLAVDNIYMYMRLADMLLKHSAEIDANLKQYRFADNMELIKKIIFPKDR